MMKKVKTLEFKSIAESCGIEVKAEQPKVLQNEVSRDSAASRDDDDISSQLQQHEANKVVAYDFVCRKSQARKRREFLLSLNQEDASDSDVPSAASPTMIQRQAQLIGD
jgi:DNA-directed RNA polymerase subunit M/transcription elongation factor TFIIS